MSRSRDLANLADEATGGLVKADIGLGNVDNTSDANKPVSTAQQTEIDKLAYQGEPHIIPGVLYPAVADKMLDGTTSLSASTTGPGGSTVASSKYGTVQSDGRMYYYTDIKGSKPIKDPRIGGHFGSQRHKFKSLQLLEQETATEGSNVYSIDGREWCRHLRNTGATTVYNTDEGVWIQLIFEDSSFFEITGYFSSVNLIGRTHTSSNYGVKYALNGGSYQTLSSGSDFNVSVTSPLINRYVDCGSVINVTSTTLGLNTIKISTGAMLFGFELIAQDTTSTANRSKIQIPSQDVVSFGKKFPISAEGSSGHHYDPFTTMSYGGSGTTLSALESLIDTDTSLGMDAWKAGTSNYHRPWNGGRVIKWVDSSGTIKTSVNMMPPNAQNIGTTASNAVSDAHVIAGTNDDTINFNTSAIDHSQAEVAKTFHVKEFGNGSANGGTGATYADATMLTSSADDIAYVMDDGLTSLSAHNAYNNGDASVGITSANKFKYYTFIGTGFAIKQSRTSSTPNENHTITVDGVEVKTNHVFSDTDFVQIAQNLPYGTHVVKILKTNHSLMAHFTDVSFYQPKRPPIPEDACILADFMLMADFVPQTSAGLQHISKGVRACSASRDMVYNHSSGFQITNPFVPDPNSARFGDAYWLGNSNGLVATRELVCFGNSFSVNWFQAVNELPGVYKITAGQDGTTDLTNYTRASNSAGSSGAVATNGTVTRNNGTAKDNYMTAVAGASVPLGVQTIKITSTHTNVGQYEYVNQISIHTPIHTSSHYQAFETPFLHELVGGDRNMEQTKLVVSPDGKTWDQITRNTSYLGNHVLNSVNDNNPTSNSDVNIFDNWRGTTNSAGSSTIKPNWNKDFAIAYDKVICLKNGSYQIMIKSYEDNGEMCNIYINDVLIQQHYTSSTSAPNILITYLNRGDTIKITGQANAGAAYNQYAIVRI